MTIRLRRLSDEHVAGHVEVERQETCCQSGHIRFRSRIQVSNVG